MNLTGGRTTLILNICALVLALIINIEGACIVYHIVGVLKWSDWIVGFVPALVMFIVRVRWFSYIFLFLHIIIAVHMVFVLRNLYLGDPYAVDPKTTLDSTLFFFVSLLSLAAYIVIVLVSSVALALLNKPKQSVVDNRN